MISTDNSRCAAARIVASVLSGQAFDSSSLPVMEDRGLILELVFGTLRWSPKLSSILNHFLKQPLRSKDNDVQALMMIGLYQLLHTRIPPHAAISETVDGVSNLGKSWAKGLVNAVLRSAQRAGDFSHTPLIQDPEFQSAHPSWFLNALAKYWPEDQDQILCANNQHPPFFLRVNCLRTSRDEYAEILRTQARLPLFSVIAPEAIRLESALRTSDIPGFNEGYVSLQDESAQLCAEVLQASPHMRVLDACAAPGGKAAHLLEKTPDLDLLAIDISDARLQRVAFTFDRLGLSARTLAADACTPNHWWDGSLFDRILIDAPCSGTGVIRRHPDIKLLRRESDIAQFAEQQARLLKQLWPLLKPNGLLVYATCSIMPQENWQVVEQFMSVTPDCRESPIQAMWGLKQSVGRQILPSPEGGDGFYYARLRKTMTDSSL